MKKIIVAVTGAAGQINYSFLFRLASGQVFGSSTRVELRLLEVEPALKALEGVCMELEDCAFPLLDSIHTTADPVKAFTGVNWAILVGSIPRKAGMERVDLLQKNAVIFAKQGEALNDNAADDVRVFVVGNPCNTNCMVAMHHAPNVPKDRFYAMTRLDQNRATFQLAKKAGVKISEVHDMVVWGNHSGTQYPDFYHAKIGNRWAVDLLDETWLKESFLPLVQNRGGQVIQARGASSAASAANALIDSLIALMGETSSNVYSVALCSTGEYGVDSGLIFSFPCRTEHGKVSVVEGIKHNAFGHKKLEETLQELRSERQAVMALGLLG